MTIRSREKGFTVAAYRRYTSRLNIHLNSKGFNMKRLLVAAAIFLAIPFMIGTTLLADDGEKEVKVRLEDCPKSVQKTLKRESQGGKIEEIVKETEDGKVVYEAEVEIDGKEYEIEVAEDGTLLSKVLEDDDEDDDD